MAVMVSLKAVPAVWVAGVGTVKEFSVEGLTVTERPAPLLMEPSLTVMFAVSALYRVMTPLLEPDTVETPLLKVMFSLLPKVTTAPFLAVTVGLLLPMAVAPP